MLYLDTSVLVAYYMPEPNSDAMTPIGMIHRNLNPVESLSRGRSG